MEILGIDMDLMANIQKLFYILLRKRLNTLWINGGGTITKIKWYLLVPFSAKTVLLGVFGLCFMASWNCSRTEFRTGGTFQLLLLGVLCAISVRLKSIYVWIVRKPWSWINICSTKERVSRSENAGTRAILKKLSNCRKAPLQTLKSEQGVAGVAGINLNDTYIKLTSRYRPMLEFSFIQREFIGWRRTSHCTCGNIVLWENAVADRGVRWILLSWAVVCSP